MSDPAGPSVRPSLSWLCTRRSRRAACSLPKAQNINVVALYPWLMLPVICVVLAFNFFGDGLHDAADPYT